MLRWRSDKRGRAMNTTEQLEHETEETREQISATLDELRARMTPGHVVDQLVDFASDSSGGMFFRNLRQQVIDNPVPVALMGAGFAWLAMAGRHGPNKGAARGESLASRTQEGVAGAKDRVSASASRAADNVPGTADE